MLGRRTNVIGPRRLLFRYCTEGNFALQPSRRRASCPTLLARGSHKNRISAIIIMIIIMIISTIVRIVMLATPSCALHRRGSRGRRCTVQLSGWRIFFRSTGSAARSESAESQTAQSTTFLCEVGKISKSTRSCTSKRDRPERRSRWSRALALR